MNNSQQAQQNIWTKLGSNDEATLTVYNAQKVAKRIMRNMENVQAEDLKDLNEYELSILEGMADDKYQAIYAERSEASKRFYSIIDRTDSTNQLITRRYNKLASLNRNYDLCSSFLKMVRKAYISA